MRRVSCSSFLFGTGRLSLFFDHALGSLLLTQHADPLGTASCGQIIAPLGGHHFDLRRRGGEDSKGGKNDRGCDCPKQTQGRVSQCFHEQDRKPAGFSPWTAAAHRSTKDVEKQSWKTGFWQVPWQESCTAVPAAECWTGEGYRGLPAPRAAAAFFVPGPRVRSDLMGMGASLMVST
jgi:hypothetical protein